jgi:hypothetical protein
VEAHGGGISHDGAQHRALRGVVRPASSCKRSALVGKLSRDPCHG